MYSPDGAFCALQRDGGGGVLFTSSSCTRRLCINTKMTTNTKAYRSDAPDVSIIMQPAHQHLRVVGKHTLVPIVSLSLSVAMRRLSFSLVLIQRTHTRRGSERQILIWYLEVLVPQISALCDSVMQRRCLYISSLSLAIQNMCFLRSPQIYHMHKCMHTICIFTNMRFRLSSMLQIRFQQRDKYPSNRQSHFARSAATLIGFSHSCG